MTWCDCWDQTGEAKSRIFLDSSFVFLYLRVSAGRIYDGKVPTQEEHGSFTVTAVTAMPAGPLEAPQPVPAGEVFSPALLRSAMKGESEFQEKRGACWFTLTLNSKPA